MLDLAYPPIPEARVLVVDDEATPRMAITRALNLMGYKADAAASGTQALERLATTAYDLMLLDLRMPGMDGVEVMKRVRENYPNTLIVILTAHATLESAVVAVKSGATDYLLKPCSIREIGEAVARALQQRQERLRRQHLIRVMADALSALQDEGKATAQHGGASVERFIRAGRLTLDQTKGLLLVTATDGKEARTIPLTSNEAALMGHFLRHPDTVFSCRHLAKMALGYDVSEREAAEIIRPHISRLRRKVEPDSVKPRLIRTIRGKGYLYSPA